MLVMADARIDALIAEDVPYIDLTTELLGIGKNQGRMTYVTREDCVVAGTDANCRIAQRNRRYAMAPVRAREARLWS